MYALSFEGLRAVESFDDDFAKGSFPDVDFFAPSGTLAYPWPIYNFHLSCCLEYIEA